MSSKKPTEQPTPRQMEVLKAMAHLKAKQCFSPTMAELAQHLNISRTTVFEHTAELRRKRYIAGSRGRARSLKLTAQANRLLKATEKAYENCQLPETIETRSGLPFLGRVAAGEPIEAIENAEIISLDTMFGTADEIFALQVAGDSMIDEGIHSGDYIICKQSQTAFNGQLAVAIVDEGNATLKRFYNEGSRARLQPANDAYDPIYSDNCRIAAIVLGLLRRL